MTERRVDRGTWRGWHGDRYAYVDLSVVVRCRGARILAVTREKPARVLARFAQAELLDRGLDARGVFWLGLDDKLQPSSQHVDRLEVLCPRHDSLGGGHRLSIPRLVAEWQGVNLRRKSALVLDVARLVERPPAAKV